MVASAATWTRSMAMRTGLRLVLSIQTPTKSPRTGKAMNPRASMSPI